MNRRSFLTTFAGGATYLAIPPIYSHSQKEVVHYPEQPIKDVHIHLLGSSSKNGCFLSDRFQNSFAVRFSRLFTDLGDGDTPEARIELMSIGCSS
ncbi:MAG: hypothetical protein CMG71_03195 [Candidatus Marinimicrobia bacterium]|nr:hypothetical protein [Candidatus Neomarinimicrobiota bacterium]